MNYFLNRQFWLFSILLGRQLGHLSHSDSLSEQGLCQKHGAGTPFGSGLLVVFEAVQFAFKYNHHRNPQETPPHILVINTQTLTLEGKKKEEKERKSDFIEYFISFFLTYDEFSALPFLAAGYIDLVCFIQFRSFPDPWHSCSIQAEPQKPELTRSLYPFRPQPLELPCPCPPYLQPDVPGASQHRRRRWWKK